MGDHGGRATPPRPPRRRWRPWLAVLVGALALALSLAACSGGDKPSGVASLSGSDKTTTTNANRGGDKLAAELNWARCMRQHGINMPDPQITADGIGQQWPERAERETPKFRAAQQACDQAVPPARR
jgi:hypothetical protein